MRLESTATSVSWIPSESITGLMRSAFSFGLSHYDRPPPGTLSDLEELRRADGFRFANPLSVWAEFSDGQVTGHGQSGGGVMGSTSVRIGPLGVTFAGVAMPDLRPPPEIGDDSVSFTQTCGGRTAVPLPRHTTHAPFVRLQAPLVWTTLTLTLRADGRTELALAGASPFPRHWVYGGDGELRLKAGVADWAAWLDQPSWRNSPWGEEDSPVMVTAAETALERMLSTMLMHAGTKPVIHRIEAGSVLAHQGSPGDSLYVLLDGILGITVDGKPIGEVGPGAVLGERAILEGGRRTATLTAVTRIRVAEAAANVIDRDALARLAKGRRREEQRVGEQNSPQGS